MQPVTNAKRRPTTTYECQIVRRILQCGGSLPKFPWKPGALHEPLQPEEYVI